MGIYQVLLSCAAEGSAGKQKRWTLLTAFGEEANMAKTLASSQKRLIFRRRELHGMKEFVIHMSVTVSTDGRKEGTKRCARTV